MPICNALGAGIALWAGNAEPLFGAADVELDSAKLLRGPASGSTIGQFDVSYATNLAEDDHGHSGAQDWWSSADGLFDEADLMAELLDSSLQRLVRLAVLAVAVVAGACAAQPQSTISDASASQSPQAVVALEADREIEEPTTAPSPTPVPSPPPPETPTPAAEPTQTPAERAAAGLERFVNAPSMEWALFGGDGDLYAGATMDGNDMSVEGFAGRMLQVEGRTYLALPMFWAESRGAPVAAPESREERMLATLDRSNVVWLYESTKTLEAAMSRLSIIDPALKFLQSISLRDADAVRGDIAEVQRLVLDTPGRRTSEAGFTVDIPTEAVADLLFMRIHGFYHWRPETVRASVKFNGSNDEIAISFNEGGDIGDVAVLLFRAAETTLAVPDVAMPLNTSPVTECASFAQPAAFSVAGCESAYNARVFAQFVLPGETSEIDTAENELRCRDIFNVYTGGQPIDRLLKAMSALEPTTTEWAAGNRTVMCSVEFTNPVLGPLRDLIQAD